MINKQAWAITEAFSTTPLGLLLQEAGLESAETVLESRQHSYAARVLALPQGHPTHKILPISLQEGDRRAQPGEQPLGDREWATMRRQQLPGQHLAQVLAGSLNIDPSGGFEQTVEAHPSSFPGKVVVLESKDALQQAQKSRPGLVLWSDGSRLENGQVGAGVAWKPTFSQWETQELPLGKGIEVYDAELHGACAALEIAKSLGNNVRVTVFLDSQAAIKRLQHTLPGPGQALALRAHRAARQLQERQIRVTICWVPGHAGVEGNERADRAAKRAAARLPQEEVEISLAHVRRAGTEQQQKHSRQ